METLFVGIYEYFLKRKSLLWAVFVVVLVLIAGGASQIKLEEDITKIFPDDERARELNYVFQNSKFVDRLVVMVSVKDSSVSPQPDNLVNFAEEFIDRINIDLSAYVNQVTGQVDDSRVREVFDVIHKHLPIFLTEKDYIYLDSILQPDAVGGILHEHYKQLISPAGILTKQIIGKDPLGFSFIVLKKLQQIQYDENFELYDNFILTKDKRHLIFFIQPAYAPNDTKNNVHLIDGLNTIISDMSVAHADISASYFGTAAVAVGNATQLRNDTILTVSLTVVLLGVLLIGFFKKKRVPFLIFLPVLFGATFSLCCIFLIKGTVSILAVAAGSVILGIAINYSFHFLVHLKHTGDIKTVVKDLVRPMTLGSTTTVLAFLCLQFANAPVLRDIGLFAAFSLIGAALCSLIFLPHFLNPDLFKIKHEQNLIERISHFSIRSGKYVTIVIFILTPIFFYFARQVTFSSDVGKLNFMDTELRAASKQLESINKASQRSIYIVAKGKDLEEAFRKSEMTVPVLDSLKISGAVHKYASVSTFLISDSLQQLRINRWNKFWTSEKRKSVSTTVHAVGRTLNYSNIVLGNFDSLITKEYKRADHTVLSSFRKAFLDDYIIEKNGEATVITLVQVSASDKDGIYAKLKKAPVLAFDRQMLTNIFVEYVNADFTFIVMFTSILVFVVLLVSYGRIELTIIAFLPMLITWIWILGIMALVGIEFNIVNVMISTFIFGLGDDYSIFIMDGLQQEYKQNKQNLPSIRISIFMSALTTICGLGVLIFAQHPALRSIAAIAIIGITCVFVMSQTIEPALFHWLTNRTKKGLPPLTFFGISRSIFTYGFFVLGSFSLTIIGLVLKPIPLGRKRIRLFYHTLISLHTRSLVYLAFSLKKKIINRTPETFSRPSVIICNHSSFLDILCTVMLSPRLILLTNTWVWNSPFFGGVVRLADYYPVLDGVESSLDRLRAIVNDGYSIVVFPEGSRSYDGRIRRFHKGAFYLAEKLNIPIRPLLIHGAHEGIKKHEIYLNESHVTLKFLPPIMPDDNRFGNGYSEHTKNISKYFKEEHKKLSTIEETPAFFSYRLNYNYLYKGPVLEWYLRVKLRLENNYEPFTSLIPKQAKILDMGCGYGFLCYMLQFLSSERQITGIDHDAEKIDTAQYGYLKTDQLNFVCADITTFPMETYDVIILNDVLHYLTKENQDLVLEKVCNSIKPGGQVLIRDANTDLKKKHFGTKLSELFSVKLIRFNKANNALQFMSAKTLQDAAAERNFSVTVLDDSKFTSNVIFVLKATGKIKKHG